jgi:putative DNA primase/helicase
MSFSPKVEATRLRCLRICPKTLVEAYLAARGVLGVLPDGVLGEVLRFHPACPFDGERVPCMIALVRNIHTNTPQAVHRIAIEREADGSIRTKGVRRRALGPINDGAIKLIDNAEVTTCLGIGEGIESTLSMRRRPLFMASPVWALISAGGIQAFPMLAGIEVLFIAVDNDKPDLKTGKRAGQDAAKACMERWTDAGREVFRITSKTAGEDLNDVARRTVP